MIPDPADSTYDTLIIGGGHNGLCCAAYLARAGRRVCVLERHHTLGGAAITEELAPGYRCSTASYVISLLQPEIEHELQLARHGYRVLPRQPSSFTPLPDGRSLLLGADGAANQREIAAFSARDAAAYPHYEAWLTRVAAALEPALAETPPDLLPLPTSWRRRSWRQRWRALRRARHLWQALRSLGEEQASAIELLTGAATPILDRWFESDALKATLATDAVIGTFAPPSAAGTAYVLLHHVMGMAGGSRGVWGYVEGGMGALTQALAAAAREAGAELRCEAEVQEILVEGGRAVGVRLRDGQSLRARQIASSATAELTFRHLLPSQTLPAAFEAAVARIDYASASCKINLAVSELPDFLARPGKDRVGPQHRGTIHISPSMAWLERACADARVGLPSLEPIIEMTIPTSVDTTLAPPGHHIIGLFVQYAPYHLSNLHWDDFRERFADRVSAVIDRYAPNFSRSVLHRQVLTPPDLERRFALTGGNIFHGAMHLHQLFGFRPVAGWADYRTPLPGLYLCGASAHPGGGVMGTPGRNAAQALLQDR